MMRGILIFLGLILTTGTAIADRPVTQEESERLQAALKEQPCSLSAAWSRSLSSCVTGRSAIAVPVVRIKPKKINIPRIIASHSSVGFACVSHGLLSFVSVVFSCQATDDRA